ncbi:hypothetical protein L7F22_046936 [Adiantum nelumboides]|nr:hypothetical protein [Adiantum nelumboides]
MHRMRCMHFSGTQRLTQQLQTKGIGCQNKPSLNKSGCSVLIETDTHSHDISDEVGRAIGSIEQVSDSLSLSVGHATAPSRVNSLSLQDVDVFGCAFFAKLPCSPSAFCFSAFVGWKIAMAALKVEEKAHPPKDQLDGFEYCIDSNPPWRKPSLPFLVLKLIRVALSSCFV